MPPRLCVILPLLLWPPARQTLRAAFLVTQLACSWGLVVLWSWLILSLKSRHFTQNWREWRVVFVTETCFSGVCKSVNGTISFEVAFIDAKTDK